MKIKKLLFVTKFEKLSYTSLQSILDLRQASLEHVVFVYVIEREHLSMYRTGYKKDEEIRLRERANIRFIDWAEHLFEQGMEVGVYIEVGSVVPQIIESAENEDADIIVIGRPQKGVLEQLYSGSDVAELLRRASVPVMVFKHDDETPVGLTQPFQRPLLAMDGSAPARKAVSYLTELGAVIDAVDVVNVVSEKAITGGSAMEIQKARKVARHLLEEICDIFEAAGVPANPHMYVGDAAEQIEKAAQELRSSLVVLGSSAKSAWVERWIGSTPRTIAEKTGITTLLIPPDRQQ
jgi:nucleotide-binding universal stress UspA family protein